MVYTVIFGPDIQLEIFVDVLSLHLHQHNSIMQTGIIHTYDD